jgi:hypothetical protein
MNEAPDGLVDCSEGAETRPAVASALAAARAQVKRLQGEADVLAFRRSSDLAGVLLELQLARRVLARLELEVAP